MSENSTEESSKLQDNSPNHRVDGAILDARSRLSLLKDQLVNLSYEVSRTSELDVERRNSTSPTAFNNRTNTADAESASEVQDNYQSAVDLHEGSSSSSRSWSVGRSTGFGPNGVDLILQKDPCRTGSLPQLNQRGFESPFRSESSQGGGGGGEGFHPSKKEVGNSTQGWILNSMYPFSCWPREEETVDFRWTVMKNQNQQSLKAKTLTKQGSKVSKISLAVRSAIGKIWEEVNQDISQEILNLVQSFFSIEDRGKIDPRSCWISGRALSAISDGLPFALTVHTYTSIGKPCISGHANVTVEVTSMDLENAEAVEKALQDFEQRAYGVSSKSSFSMPEHPITDHYKTPSRAQILSSDFDSVPPLFPIREQGEEVGIRRRSDKKELPPMTVSMMMKEAGSESLSTFSFNSVNQNKRDQDNRTSGSSDTFSTADLTAFIRHGGQRQLPAHSTGAELDSAAKNRTGHRQRTVFSELDLVWEMHYPDCAKMETVIASRKYQRDQETSHQSHHDVTSRSTYIGDTDSDSSFDVESAPSTSREVILHQDPFTHESQDQTISRQRPIDQWDDVVDSRQGRLQQDLTESMEVNFDEEQERNRRWGRIQKLSSFVRRVKKMIGTSSSEGKRSRKSSQNDAIQEPTNQEPTLRFYSPEPSTPSERRLSTSPSGQRSAEGYYSAPSTESEYHNLDSSPGGQQPASPGHALDTPSTRKSLESPTGDRGLFLTGGHVGSFGSSGGQNVSWDESRSVKLPVKDLGNGQYLALGHLTGQGRYQISVKIGNKKISEEPFLTTVADANSLGSGISSDGPFFQRPDSTTVSASSTVPIPHPNFPPCHSISYDPDRLEYALRHPHLGFVDLLLIVDCTSSMGVELQQLPSVVQGIEDLIKDSVLLKRLRMGVIAYRDHDPEDDDTFLLRTQDLTQDVEKVKRFLNSLEAEGGGDYPEAMEVAFAEAVEGVQWSLFSSRFVLWIGDAPPHGYQGFTRKEALEEEEKFKEAKTRLKKAAREVELAMKNNESPRQMNVHDRELADALSTCDAIAKYHDKYPLGIPGGVRWEETIERLSSLGVRTLVMGLRDSVSHEPSRNCLRTIAHISGGALLEIVALDSSVIAPLIVAIVEQSMDQQLIEEEVCDLILCLKNDFEHQSLEDKKRSLVESMSQAAKQPYRLQVAPKGGFSESPGSSRMDHGLNELDHRPSRPDSRVSNVPSSSRGSGGSLGPLTISGQSFDLHSSSSMMDSKALLLGMVSIRFDEAVLEQVLKNLRIKAEVVSHCLLSNFESMEQWVDFHLCQVSESSGLYKGQRRKISGLTTPLSIRYILALQTMAQQRN